MMRLMAQWGRHAVVILGLAMAACGDDSSMADMGGMQPDLLMPDMKQAPVCVKLDASLTWYGTNRDKLDKYMESVGKCSPGYDPTKKPLAIFDWDNTVVKNDVGDATFFWMIAHDKILQPPMKNWKLTSPYLSADSIAALDAACAALADAGKPLPTTTNAACAKEIVSIYNSGTTAGGKAAWSGWNYRRMEPAYAWVAHLFAGYTPAEIKTFTMTAMMENINNPIDTRQNIGGVMVTHWVRIYDQIKDLVAKMQANGFDVWVVSASPQHVVEVWGGAVGVSADKVIGIRTVEQMGKLTYNLQGCGDVPAGTNDGMGGVTGNSMITYIEGKRCWINKAIWGDMTANAMMKNSDMAKRPSFGAGDSDTDISFLQDATGLKLAINRNRRELMCNAYNNAGMKWIINPMFIQPRAQQMTDYLCSTTACRDAAGASVPCKDENGMTIPDQKDTVY